jgi:hypothetical protein
MKFWIQSEKEWGDYNEDIQARAKCYVNYKTK